MTKKEIQEELNNLSKPKYLYQRYNGEMRKYEVQDNILIDVKNANNIINLDKQIILGKTSEDKIDLLEVDDLILYKCININSDKLELDIIKDEVDLQDYKNRFKDNFWELISFVTKEKFNKVVNNMED